MTAIQKILDQANAIANGDHDKISPGQPQRISEAASVGDQLWQGDLGFVVRDSIPDDYEQRSLTQLVPGTTQGARHCLEHPTTVYVPSGWGDGWERLDGPYIVADKDVLVTHPTHGNVTIPAGMIVECRYQREWDAEKQRERRNAD